MHNQDEWVEQLKNNRLARSKEEVKAFEGALQELERFDRKAVVLSEVLLAYDDRCEMIDLQNLLNKYIWTFSIDSFVNAFIEVIVDLYKQAPEWAYMHLGSILANDKTYSCFQSEMKSISQDKRRVFEILLQKHADNEEDREFENEELSALLEKISLRAKSVIEQLAS